MPKVLFDPLKNEQRQVKGREINLRPRNRSGNEPLKLRKTMSRKWNYMFLKTTYMSTGNVLKWKYNLKYKLKFQIF